MSSLLQFKNFQRTSIDTIAILTPKRLSLANTPLILSDGMGKDSFLKTRVISKPVNRYPTMSGKLLSTVSNAYMEGDLIYHPQSTALIGLRQLYFRQLENKTAIECILSVLSPASKIGFQFKDFVVSSPVLNPNINKSLDDVVVSFNSQIPQEISLGGINSLLSLINIA